MRNSTEFGCRGGDSIGSEPHRFFPELPDAPRTILAQQFDTDKTICLGKMQQANLSGVAVYSGGIYGAIAMQQRAQAADTVARGCMAEKGYELVPIDQAEARREQLATIYSQKLAQDAKPSKTAQKK